MIKNAKIIAIEDEEGKLVLVYRAQIGNNNYRQSVIFGGLTTKEIADRLKWWGESLALFADLHDDNRTTNKTTKEQ